MCVFGQFFNAEGETVVRERRVRNFARMKEVFDAIKLSIVVKNEGGFQCSQE